MTTAGVFSVVQVHRRGVHEEVSPPPSYRARRRGVPGDDRGSALCRAGFIDGEYLKEYLMTIWGVFCVMQSPSMGST